MKLIKSLLFADDTALLANGSNIEALTDFVNDEFHKVVYYFKKKIACLFILRNPNL